MIGAGRFNYNRRIILQLIAAFCVASNVHLHCANAQVPAPSPPDSEGTYTSLVSSRMIVVTVLVTTFFVIGFFSVSIRKCMESESGSVRGGANWLRRDGLDPSVVESFPTFAYSSVKEGIKALECAVCLNEFKDDDDDGGDTLLKLLPKCNHVFHADCIGAWLSSHSTCPVCRAKLAPDSRKLSAQETESASAGNQGNSCTGDSATDHVVIDVHDEDGGNIDSPAEKRRFSRSNSTGRLLVEANCGGRLRRARSYDAVLAAAREGISGISVTLQFVPKIRIR